MSRLNALLRSFLARRDGNGYAPPVPNPPPVDLAGIRSKQSTEIELRHPVSGDPLGAFVTLASPDHPERRQARIDIARAQRGRADPDGDESVELVDAAALEFLSRIVLGWRRIKVDGVELDYSPGAVRELLAPDAMRWLTNQILHEAGRTENFIETSAIA